MENASYDKSIGSDDRTVVGATKLWSIIIGIVVLLGLGMLIFFFVASDMRDWGGPASENTATRPAEP
jgi:hypothetical protein